MATAQPGTYWARFASAQLCEGKKAAYLAFDFEATHIAANGNWQQLPEPLKRSISFSFSDAAYDYTEKKLIALGFNGDFENPAFDKIKDGVQVNCSTSTQDGKTSENWDLAEWGTERKAAAKDVAAKLQARWGTNKAAAAPPVGRPAAPVAPKPNNTAPPVPAGVGGPVDGDGEDIPF